MKHLLQFINSANTPQNTGGGNSQTSAFVATAKKGSRPTVNDGGRTCDGQSQGRYTHTPLCKALKYAAMILLLLTLGIGNAWGQTFRYYIAISNDDATSPSGAVRVFKTSDDEHFTNVSSQFTLNSEYSTSSAGSVYYYPSSKTYTASSGDGAIFRAPRYTKNKTFTINWSNTNLSFSKISFAGVGTNSGTKNIKVKNSSTDTGSDVQFPKSTTIDTYECTKTFTQSNGITLVSANDQPAYAITILHAVDHAEITTYNPEMVTTETQQLSGFPSGGTWSIEEGGTGTGSITSTGVLTASANGTIKVKYAKDGYGEDIKTITVSDTRSVYWFAAGNTDATTNEVTNNTSFFTFTTTSTSGQSGDITIGAKTFSLTKRLNTETDLFTFVIPDNTIGTLHVVAISSGNADRTLSIKESGDESATTMGSTTSNKTAWSLISRENIAAGSYTVTADQNARLGMLYMIISKTTPAPSCSTPADPDGLAAGSISSTGATFTITDDESPASYDIYYSTNSTVPVAATEASTTTTSKTKAVTGLTANTTYYAWVRAVCDASHKSDWVALGGGTFSTLPTYSVTYNTTGSDSGSAPSDATNYDNGSAVTVLGNTGSLVKSGYVFAGWNTASTLDGTDYAPGTKFNIGANTNLYPVWAEGTEETITYVVKTSSAASTTPSTHLTNLVNETNVGIAEVTDQTKSDRSGKYATSATEGYGVSFTFDVADGYTFHPTSIAIQLATVSTTDFTFYVTLEDADGTKLTSNALNTFSKDGVLTDVTFPAYDKKLVAGTVKMLVSATRAGGAAGTYRIGKTITIKGAVKALPVSGYAITKSATNGTIATSVSSTAVISASSGDQVDIVATPNTGYEFTSWDIYKTGESSTKVTPNASIASTYFMMPAYAVTVGATFTAIDYDVTYTTPSNGSYTIKVGDASAVSANTKAQYNQTITLAAEAADGYGFSGWTVMNGETPVAVTNNQFTMPAGNVTVSASFALEPNVYYYKSASHYDGSAYKNPEGNAHDVALSNPWTIVSGGTITGVTSVVANGATFDDKSSATEKWVTSYIKLSKDDASQNITFTIASGYKATIKMKIGAWSNTPTIYLKKGSDVQAYTGTIGGVATTENNFNELTWSNLSAGVYVLNVANEGDKKNAYISQIDIQTTAVYTLTYDANGGTGTMDNTVGTGTVTLRTNTYTKSGCTFLGWATSQDNANAGTVAYADGATDYNLSANATLYAVWKLNAPTISCAANVVTMSAMSGAAIYYTTDGETTPTSSSTLYNSSSKPQIAANTTFKAIAVLENYVSSDVTTQTCEYVAPATVDDLVTIDADYTFTPSAEIAASTLTADSKFFAAGEGCTFNNGLLVKENRALAFKVNNGAKVKVTFTEKSDDSTPREMQLGTAASDDDNKAYGHSGSSPATFTVTADGVVYLTASKDLRFSTLEIFYPHTVTYALGDGTGTLPTEGAHYKGDKFNVHDGVTGITAPANYGFSAWSDGTSTYAGGAQYTMGSANVTLTAQWAPLYSVTYVKAGTEEGTVPSQVSLPDGAQFTVANQGSLVTPANKVFGGWNDGTSTYAAGDTYTIAGANVTLTAVWNDSYTVEYDANGGTGTMADGTGATVTIAANGFTYEDHKFLRWNTQPDGEGTNYAVGAEVSQSLTLYAIWKEVSCSASGVIFSLEMKTGLANESVAHGQELPLTSEYATITGGEATLRNNDGSGDDKAQIYKSEVYFNGANAYLKVDMDCGPLAVGDEIVVTSENYENELYLTNTNNTSEKIETVSRSYTIVADDLLEGKSIFYIWRKSGGTSVGTITITRPAPDAPVPTISNATPADAEYTGAASPMTVSADAEAPKDLHYQWYKEAGETDIEVGTDAASYTPTASGQYYCVVTNSPDGYTPKSATSRTATITMISSDATLAWLKADGNDIALSDGVYAYEYVIADAATVAPTITAGKNEEHASVTITQADSKTGTATVHVVAEDGETSHDYTVKFNEFSGCLTTFYFAKSADATDNGVVNNAPVRGYTVFTNVQSDGSSYGGTLTVNDVDYTATRSTSSISSFGKLVVPAKYTANLNLLVRLGSTNTSLQLVKDGESTPYMSSDIFAESGTYQYNFENVQAGTYVIRAWRSGAVQNCNYIAMAAELCRYEVSSVSLANMNLRTGNTATPEMTITPVKGAVVSQAWSFVDAATAEAAGLSINASTGAVTATNEATPGNYTVKVVLNGDNALSATCTVTVITEFSQVDVTGTTVWDFAAGKAASSKITIEKEDIILANADGITNDETFNSQALRVNVKYVSNAQLQGNSIMFHATVPGLLTVRYACTSSKSSDRVLYINDHATTSKTDNAEVTYTQAVPAGDVTIKAIFDDGGTPTVDLMNYKYIKFDANLDPTKAEESTLGGYERTVDPKYCGTVCLPKSGVMTGATLFQIAYMDYKSDGVTPYKVYYDEVENGTMQAGMPYIFLAEQSTIGVYYTATAEETAKNYNGLHGTLVNITEGMNGTGVYMLYNNKVLHSTNPASYLNANRAYIQISEIPGYNNPGYVAPAPTRRRISTGFNGTNTATGLDQITNDQSPITNKVLINGQLFILRGEKLYDATGRLVK